MSTPRQNKTISEPGEERPVVAWLLICAALIFVMVIVGGITRLTESGLSITEWKPVTGAIPPLSEAEWQEEFERYQKIPEFQERNPGMTLDDYKTIYFWEYVHRLMGRLIGAAFLIPFLWFLFTGRIRRPFVYQLGIIFVLGGLQGALGWYMVQSGLSDRVDVSPYRLTAHLALAILIYAAILWVAFDLRRGDHHDVKADGRALNLAAFVFATIMLGALVAGNDAGMIYNTFPLMDGQLAPPGYFDFDPWWQNFFENPATVQFNHRVFGVTTVVLSIVYWLAARKDTDSAWPGLVALMAVLQATVGIFTLLLVVPIPLATLHQGGALLLLTAALVAAHQGRRR
jgi:heme a synthase